MEAIQSFANAIEALQKAGLLVGLTPAEQRRIVEEELECDYEEIETIYFLQAYYSIGEHESHLSPQAVRDGFLHHDWRFGQETQDVIAELCRLVGDFPPKFKQLAVRGDFIDVEENATKTVHAIRVDSLDSVVAFFNQQLAAQGDQRRFVSMETDGDWHAYYLVNSDQYRKIFSDDTSGLHAEEIPGVENPDAWLKS